MTPSSRRESREWNGTESLIRLCGKLVARITRVIYDEQVLIPNGIQPLECVFSGVWIGAYNFWGGIRFLLKDFSVFRAAVYPVSVGNC